MIVPLEDQDKLRSLLSDFFKDGEGHVLIRTNGKGCVVTSSCAAHLLEEVGKDIKQAVQFSGLLKSCKDYNDEKNNNQKI